MTPSGQNNALLIVNYSWSTDMPELRIRNVDQPSHLTPARGFTVNYQIGSEQRRHCPGRVPFRSGQGDYIDCFNRPQAGSKNCVDCSVAAATFAGSLHHAHTRDRAEIDAAVDAHLQQANLAYLAGFRDGSIKVGTSTASRIHKRLSEQGAWHALIVAEADDGFVVRTLEDLVTERLAIAQSVGVGRKLAGIINPIDDARLRQTLNNAADNVHDLIASEALTGITRMTSTWVNPAAEDPLLKRVFPYPADLAQGSHRFTIQTMVGRIAIIDRNANDDEGQGQMNVGDLFAIDIGRLFGLELELGVFDPVEITVQDSLF